ncbi:MAG: YveK family protein [Sarcina sp.]
MNEEVIRVEDLVYALKKRWLMILSITILSTIVAGIFSFYVIKPRYQGGVKVFIGKEGGQTVADKNYNSSDIAMYQNLLKTYAEIIRTKDLAKDAVNGMGKEPTNANVGKVLTGLSVTPSEDTQILKISYQTIDKAEIVPTLTAVVNSFMMKSKQLIPNGNVQVIETPQEPTSPISPNKPLNVIIGFLLGLMISIGLAFLLEYLDNTIKNKNELESILTDIPVIGVIPKVKNL